MTRELKQKKPNHFRLQIFHFFFAKVQLAIKTFRVTKDSSLLNTKNVIRQVVLVITADYNQSNGGK